MGVGNWAGLAGWTRLGALWGHQQPQAPLPELSGGRRWGPGTGPRHCRLALQTSLEGSGVAGLSSQVRTYPKDLFIPMHRRTILLRDEPFSDLSPRLTDDDAFDLRDVRKQGVVWCFGGRGRWLSCPKTNGLNIRMNAPPSPVRAPGSPDAPSDAQTLR